LVKYRKTECSYKIFYLLLLKIVVNGNRKNTYKKFQDRFVNGEFYGQYFLCVDPENIEGEPFEMLKRLFKE